MVALSSSSVTVCPSAVSRGGTYNVASGSSCNTYFLGFDGIYMGRVFVLTACVFAKSCGHV